MNNGQQAEITPAVPALSTAERRAAWLEARRRVYTGTDIAKLFGVSRFGGPIDVWLDKRGLAEDQDSGPKRAGRYFERGILAMYADETGHPVELADPYTLVISPTFPLLGATLDARRMDTDTRPVDAKNVRFRTEKWGEPGTDEMPFDYLLQLAAQMAVTDTGAADLAVVFSGQDFSAYTTERDLDLEERIKDEIERFHAQHVLADIPPAVDGSTSWRDLLKRSRQTKSVVLDSTPEIDAWAQRLRTARQGIAAAEEVEREAENTIKQFIGEAAGVAGAWGRISWKQNRDGSKTDWEAVAKQLGASPELIAQFTKMTTGARPFKPAFVEETR